MSAARRPAVISAVVVAAGQGKRMGGPVPKPYIELDGLPILCRTLIRLYNHIQGLREIIVVVRPEDRAEILRTWERQIVASGATKIVDGGPTRQHSVEAGVFATAEEADLVLVHDAVRPFFPPSATREACRLALRFGGAILALPLAETLKRLGPDNTVSETIDRKDLWIAQTPQVFKREIIIQALKRARAMGTEGTDDAEIVEKAGYKIAIVKGSSQNIKITEPDDLLVAQAILARELETG